MFIQTCQVNYQDGQSGWAAARESIRDRLAQAGFVSIVDELSRRFQEYTGFLDFAVSAPIDLGSNSDILGSHDKNGLCIMANDEAGHAPVMVVYLVAADEDTLSQMRDAVRSADCAKDALEGTARERGQTKHLNELLQNFSPNGKALNDELISSSLPLLYDPAIRGVLRSIMDVWGTDSASLSLLDGLLVEGKGSPLATGSQLESIAANPDLFDTTYVIGCTTCGGYALEFNSEKQAKETLKRATGTNCRFCGEGKLQTDVAYKIKSPIAHGLRQGLWLEKLVCDTFEPFSAFAAAGRMVETFELV